MEERRHDDPRIEKLSVDLSEAKTAQGIMQASLDINTNTTTAMKSTVDEMKDTVDEVRDILASFRVLSKLAKWVSSIAAAVGSIWAAWRQIKGG